MVKFSFYCPACKKNHSVPIVDPSDPRSCWEFNNNWDRPSLSPSIKVIGGENKPGHICHLFVVDGFISYCGDSTHGFAGKNVPLPDFDEEVLFSDEYLKIIEGLRNER